MTRTHILKRLPLAVLALALAVVLSASRDTRAQGGLFGDMMGAGQGPHDWTGLYIGGQAGYAWGNARTNFPTVPLIALTDNNVDGFLGGGHIGYNLQAADAVFGVVADLNFTDMDGNVSGLFANALSTDVDLTGSIRGRFGILLTERFLLYGTAGVAFANIDHTFTFGVTQSWDNSYVGFTAGGGAEYAFNDMLSFFVEARWTSYGNRSFGIIPIAAPHHFSFDQAQVQGGLSIHFNNWMAGGY